MNNLDNLAMEEKAERWTAESLAGKLAKATKGKKSPKAAAMAAHKVIAEMSREWGQKPEIETICRPSGGKNWEVAWESGPYEWAIGASMAMIANGSCFCEPYYSFNLIFYAEA